MSVFNIIWGDDEIDQLINSDPTTFRIEDNEFIIFKAHDANEVKIILENNEGFIDAVISDANYGEDDTDVLDIHDNSGLAFLMSLIQQKDKVPAYDVFYYLFTARNDNDAMGSFRGSKSFRSIFKRDINWFQKLKYNIEDLLPIIMKDIEEKCSPDFAIKKRFARELDIAMKLEGVEKELKGLGNKVFTWAKAISENHNGENFVTYISEMRIFLEKIFLDATNNKFIPTIREPKAKAIPYGKQEYMTSPTSYKNSLNLTGISSYLKYGYHCNDLKKTGNHIDSYEKMLVYTMSHENMSDRVIPKPVGSLFYDTLPIIHKSHHNNAEYDIMTYMKTNEGSIFFFISVFYSFICILDWYVKLKMSHKPGKVYYKEEYMTMDELNRWKAVRQIK